MINIISMVNRELKKRHITGTKLSRLLGIHQTTVVGMLKKKSIQTHRLVEVSKALNYNFFREVAEELSITEPQYNSHSQQREAELLDEIKQLKEENKTLKIKMEVLDGVIAKIGARL